VQTLTHELKSPLSAIRGAAELLLEPGMPAADRVRFLGNIERETQRIQELVDRMMELAALESRRSLDRRAPLALEAGRAWRIARPLDVDAMHEAAQRLVGRHDFTTFRSAHCQAESPIKALDRLDVRRDGDHVLVEASARSFLHHQVRSMVGCLGLVGQGQWSVADLQQALDARDRAALGLNAPADGLYFVRARYPETDARH
jgi:tRNA pseudouridine(38-40) synthase